MLKVDLGQLERKRRLAIEEDVPPDDPLWEGSGIQLRGPLSVRLEAQQVGADVLVRGRLSGEVELECRRCLQAVSVKVNEDVSLLFRPGVERVEAEREEVYPLPARTRELDLSEPVREHLLLAVPKFAICDQACRGLCPRCGANRNLEECRCEVLETDERWAALRKLKLD